MKVGVRLNLQYVHGNVPSLTLSTRRSTLDWSVIKIGMAICCKSGVSTGTSLKWEGGLFFMKQVPVGMRCKTD